MKRLLLIAGTLVFLGACSSGGCNGDGDKKAPAGSSTSMSGGGGSLHGTNEAVSFQGLGKKGAAGSPTASAAAALGGSGPSAPADPQQSVICGGFPNLAADCKTDPAYDQVLKKCCPAGAVSRCRAIPGGARLIGNGCTAPAVAPAP
ncbi:MAG: hypothetical protein ACHQ49_14000 [Elusimicrobiota bacterium]